MRYTRKRIPSTIQKRTLKHKSRVYTIDVFPNLDDLRYGSGITKSALNKYEKSTKKLYENSSVCSFNRIKKDGTQAQCESHCNFIKGRRNLIDTDIETILRYQIPTQKYRETPLRILQNIILYTYFKLHNKKSQPCVLITTHSKRISNLFKLPYIKNGALFSLSYNGIGKKNYWILKMLHSGVRTLESDIINPKDSLVNMTPRKIYIPVKYNIPVMTIYFVSCGLGYHKVAKAGNISRNSNVFIDCPLITESGNKEIIDLRSIVICNKIRNSFNEFKKRAPKDLYLTTNDKFFKHLRGILTKYSEVASQRDKKKYFDRVMNNSQIEKFMGSQYQILINAIYSTQTHGEGQIEKLSDILVKNVGMSRINREWIFLTSHTKEQFIVVLLLSLK